MAIGDKRDDHPARVAIAGVMTECNAFAPPLRLIDFERFFLKRGDALAKYAREDVVFGFGRKLSSLRPWDCVPTVLARSESGGPVDHQDFLALQGEIVSALSDNDRVDAVYIDAHGAGVTTACDDMDGAYFSAIRKAVGPDTPIVATLDLHGNISCEMLAAVDAVIAYRTNPHMDITERAEEAALVIDALLNGKSVTRAFCRLPLVTPQVTQLTATGEPYGDLIAYGETLLDDTVFNISILSGFAFSDTDYNGMAVIVQTWNDQSRAEEIAIHLAERAWSDRHRYKRSMLTPAEATERALNAEKNSAPFVFADVGDNPGGGGNGNTTQLLQLFYKASAPRALIGVHHDPMIVAEAMNRTIGDTMDVVFSANDADEAYSARAVLIAKGDGVFRGERGMARGVDIDLGGCCALQIGTVTVLVSGYRHQIFSTDYFEQLGIDPTAYRSIVVKSRGHFRAGFAHISPEHNIFDVNTRGLTTADIQNVPWRNLRRPVYPMDPDTQWPSADYPRLIRPESGWR